MMSPKEKQKVAARYGHGQSKAAERRFVKAHSQRTHSGKPGGVIKMSDRAYVVAADGSFRRLLAVPA